MVINYEEEREKKQKEAVALSKNIFRTFEASKFRDSLKDVKIRGKSEKIV